MAIPVGCAWWTPLSLRRTAIKQQMALEVGARLGHYDVTALIGEGGMGQVYRATDTQLGRDVALKILPDAFAADPDRLARFQREAHVLASLNHPGIAAIYGIEKSDDTQALVLELVEGPTLADRIAKGPIPLDEALPIAKQIAEALEAAHEAGVIHRDLKPANIKVREDGTVKVLDFGLAKGFQPGGSDPSHSTLTMSATASGVIMGTAAYMSPEQAQGKPVDQRTDVWAFGAVLYEMLTGQRAFGGADVSSTLVAVLSGEVDLDVLPPATPPRLRQIVLTCLRKDPMQRVHHIADVRLAMEGAFESEVATPGVTGAAPPPRLWQRPVPVLLAVVLAALVSGLSVWGLRPVEPRAVTRIAYDLPPNLQLRSTSRAVLAVSPDGRRFVYNTSEGLFLRTMDAFEARVLSGTEDNLGLPFFSPDGASVGYFKGGEVKRIAVSGGAPVSIGPSAGPFGASWAPDNTILFDQDEGIMRVPANGGTPELIIPAADGEVFDAPQLLPDGDTVLFSVSTSSQPSRARRSSISRATGSVGAAGWDTGQIVAQSLTSGERRVLLEGGSDARYVPTGHLVYALDDGLFAVAFDVDTLTVVSGPVSMVEGVARARTAASANFDVSDDGTLFYLAGDAGDSRLVWVDRTGRVEPIETIPPNQYASPRLSPDGERLLIVAEDDLRVYDLASGREIRLTTDGATGTYAVWSLNGTEVAYTSSRGATGQDIWTQPADGSGTARQLTALEGRVHVDDWAPDGRTVTAHHHGSESIDQLVVSLDGDMEPDRWLEREFRDSNAVFSPDGRYVAYVSEQTGQLEIHIQPFPGQGAEVTVSVGGGDEPAWAANGELFYRRPSDSTMIAIEVLTDPELAIGPPTELFVRGATVGGGPRARYAVTVDGQRFLIGTAQLPSTGAATSGAARTRVNVVLNWTEELKERVPVP